MGGDWRGGREMGQMFYSSRISSVISVNGVRFWIRRRVRGEDWGGRWRGGGRCEFWNDASSLNVHWCGSTLSHGAAGGKKKWNLKKGFELNYCYNLVNYKPCLAWKDFWGFGLGFLFQASFRHCRVESYFSPSAKMKAGKTFMSSSEYHGSPK